MPPSLPDGKLAAPDGRLPATALAGLAGRKFGIYVHVPFCATRCGYCDFNTYTAPELGDGGSRAAYPDSVLAELRLARRVLGEAELPVSTVFFGGGTPTLLSAAALGRILAGIDSEFGLAPAAEVTTEANPESVDPAYLDELRRLGFNRVSFGMQSARPHVLAVLDRRHTPGRPVQCVAWARVAGFEQVSLDLIYGAPGESLADWRDSVEVTVAAEPDHVSAYALVVEEGTRLARQVARGELSRPDDDDMADKYLLADQLLRAAGYRWYEISNWARSGAACRHNLGYWRGQNWWGVGPGAHSFVGGTRWWNVKHPAAYAASLAGGTSPALAGEVLTDAQRRLERVLLGLRLAEGLPVAELTEVGRSVADSAVAEGLLQPAPYAEGVAVLTPRGRLLADAVVRDLVD